MLQRMQGMQRSCLSMTLFSKHKKWHSVHCMCFNSISCGGEVSHSAGGPCYGCRRQSGMLWRSPALC